MNKPKNIKPEQLKNCIMMPFSEYVNLIKTITNNDIEIHCDCEEGVSYTSHTNNKMGTHTFVNDLLSKHLNVTVTSIHTDQLPIDFLFEGEINIWIVYE